MELPDTLALPDYFEDYATYEVDDTREYGAQFRGHDYELAVKYDVNADNKPLYLVYFQQNGKLVETHVTTDYDLAIGTWDLWNDKYGCSIWQQQDEDDYAELMRDQNRDYFG